MVLYLYGLLFSLIMKKISDRLQQRTFYKIPDQYNSKLSKSSKKKKEKKQRKKKRKNENTKILRLLKKTQSGP